MFTNRLAFKFIIPISLMIVITAFASSFIFIRSQSGILQASIREKADTLARNLSYNSEYGVLLKDASILNGLVEGVMKEKDVQWIEIRSKDGRVLAVSGMKQAPFYIAGAEVMVEKSDGRKSSAEQLLLPEAPKSSVRELAGSIHLGISLSETGQKINDLRVKFGVISFAQILLAIVLTMVLVKTVTSPLEKLAVMTKKIAAGDLSAQTEVKSNDEIGHLAAAFNKMTNDLKRILVSRNELENSSSLLLATLEATTDGVLVVNMEGKIVIYNHRFAELWRIPESILSSGEDEKLLAFVMDQLKDPESFMRKVRELYATPEAESCDLIEFKDGRVFERYSCPQVLGDQIAGRVWNFRDITQRVRAEEEKAKLSKQVLQSEKMSAVGQLAAGVAHEINNPLGIILGFSQGLAQRVKPGDPIELPVKSIEREAVRCKNLVQDLLTFSRADKSERVPLDLNKAIEGSIALANAAAKMNSVDIQMALAPDLPHIFANQNQTQQIVINLANNAVDAMPKGGTLCISTSLLNEPPQSWVCLKISDTGNGIPEDIQSRIFDPFFTTKAVGKGTGLGLSLVFEIVQKHSGTIELSSKPGHTEFCVKFPVRAG